jgi:hypothetical protein
MEVVATSLILFAVTMVIVVHPASLFAVLTKLLALPIGVPASKKSQLIKLWDISKFIVKSLVLVDLRFSKMLMLCKMILFQE